MAYLAIQLSKSTPQTWRSRVMRILRLRIKTGFFSFITTILVLITFLFSLIQNVELSVNSINNYRATWATELMQVLDLDSDKELEAYIQDVSDEVRISLLPFSSLLNIENQVEKEITEFKRIVRIWLNAIKPLTYYTLEQQGLISTKYPDRYFSDDLAYFFDILPNIIQETEFFWKRINGYRQLIQFTGSERAKTALDYVSTLLEFGKFLSTQKGTILTAIGHYSTQRVVIFNQNVGEARPTGGFLGSYIPVNISKGRMVIQQSQSIYFSDGQTPNLLFSHPANWNYGIFQGHAGAQGFRNANYFPCFPTSARYLAREFASSTNGFTIDSIVMITPQFLLNLLPENFILDIKGVTTLNRSNFFNEIERITSLNAPDSSNPKSQLTPVLKGLINKLDTITENKKELGYNLLQSVASRDIQFWWRNDEIQEIGSMVGLTGEQTCKLQAQKPTITPLIANISADKRNLVTQNQFNIWQERGFAGNTFYLKYKQILPEKPVLQRGFTEIQDITFVGIQIPSQATNLEVSSPQALHFPFLRPYYSNLVLEEQRKPMFMPSEIEHITKNSYNLYNQEGNPPGFVYEQPDGSRVVGIYINDLQVSEVEFKFWLPNAYSCELRFYGQPGLNQSSISLGKNLYFKSLKNTEIVTNSMEIQSGLDIQSTYQGPTCFNTNKSA